MAFTYVKFTFTTTRCTVSSNRAICIVGDCVEENMQSVTALMHGSGSNTVFCNYAVPLCYL